MNVFVSVCVFVCTNVYFCMSVSDDDLPRRRTWREVWVVGWLLFMFLRTFICVRVSVLVIVYSLPSKYSCTMLGIPLRNTLTCIKQINNKNDSGGDCDNNDNSNNHHNNPAHADSHTNRIIHTYPSTKRNTQPTYTISPLCYAPAALCAQSVKCWYTNARSYIHTYMLYNLIVSSVWSEWLTEWALCKEIPMFNNDCDDDWMKKVCVCVSVKRLHLLVFL